MGHFAIFLIIFGKNTCCMPQPIHNDAKAPSSPTLKKEKLFSRPQIVTKVQLSVFGEKMGHLAFFSHFFWQEWYLYNTTYS